MNQKQEITFSPWTVISIVLILGSLYLLYFIRDIIVLFFLVLILSASFRPIVNRWEKKMHRVPAVLAMVLILIFILALVSYVIFPPLIHQFKEFLSSIPDLINRYNLSESYKKALIDNIKTFTSNPANITGGFVSITTGLFGGIFSFVTVIVLTIYLLLEKDALKRFIGNLLPANRQEAVATVGDKIAEKVGNWFRGQLLLCLTIGVLYYIILVSLGIPYALPLAVIGAILEIVPTIGPIISGILSVLIALTVSPIVALIALILFVVVQQLENTFLVPKIMQRAVGLSPVVIILAILIGAKILGVAGALIAVPMAASLSVVVQEWDLIKKSFGNE